MPQQSPDFYDVLTEDEKVSLLNHWEDGMGDVITKLGDSMVSRFKDTLFGDGPLTPELIYERRGVVKGMQLMIATISGEVQNVLKEIEDAETRR